MEFKTDDDAARLFTKQIVNPLKKIDPFFLPNLDRAKGFPPKSILSFNKTAQRGASKVSEDEQELNSEISFRASGEKAYDGEQLYFYIADECGKSDRANVYKRHEIVEPCMYINGTQLVGKMLYTTTVEDIGDSDMYSEGNFKRLWDESNQAKKD